MLPLRKWGIIRSLSPAQSTVRMVLTVAMAEIVWRKYVRTCGNKFWMQLLREQGTFQLSEEKLEHAAHCARWICRMHWQSMKCICSVFCFWGPCPCNEKPTLGRRVKMHFCSEVPYCLLAANLTSDETETNTYFKQCTKVQNEMLLDSCRRTFRHYQ